MTLKGLSLPTVLAGLFLAAGTAQAQVVTKTANMNVSINIKNSCTFGTIGNLNFGSHDFAITSNVDVDASFELNCTKNTPYTIALSSGLNGTTVADRKMKSTIANATETIPYQLYKTAARGAGDVWGDTGTDVVNVTAAASAGGNKTYTVFGRVPPQTAGAAGNFADAVTITVSY